MAKSQIAVAAPSLVRNLAPELAVIAAGTALEWAPGPFALGCKVAEAAVTIDQSIAEPGLSGVLRFALEWSAWRQSDPNGNPEAVAAYALAAALAASAYVDLHRRSKREAMRAGLPIALRRLIDAAASSNQPADLAFDLMPCVDQQLDAEAARRTWQRFNTLRPLALPIEALMLQAGDNRLDLDPDSGCNRYGGSPFPRADVAEFSSSTASDVSTLALSAAESLRRSLMPGFATDGGVRATEAAARRIKADLLKYLGLDDDGSVIPILAASGTTATLFATHVALGQSTRPAMALVVGPEETGRGVPAAAVGRHAAPVTPTGASVEQNGLIAGMPAGLRIERLSIRNSQGRPLQADSLAEPIAGIVAQETAARRRVILHVLEGSKTGLVAPGIAPVMLLRRWFPDLAIVVDACQLRTGAAVLRRYLATGCIVALSGSKFMGGPSFSGALLVPAPIFEGMAPLPPGFVDYSWRGDWPDEDKGRCHVLPRAINPGLLARWRAALAEMNAFSGVPVARVAVLLDEIGKVVRAALLASSDVALLPAMPATGADSESWTSRPSIYSFAVHRPDGTWLDEAALRKAHQLLARDVTDGLPPDASPEQHRVAARICHLGQPVAFAAGPYPAALRIAIGARRIVAANRPGGIEVLRRDLDDVIAKLRLLVRLRD